MGNNQRYGERDIRTDQRVAQAVARDGSRPQGLKSVELELSKFSQILPPSPVAVYAWIRIGDIPVRVAAEAHRWTERCVAISFELEPGEEVRIWVWASAVSRR